jgi:photosystem II stability/assembly factor-like uncharacterized protein
MRLDTHRNRHLAFSLILLFLSAQAVLSQGRFWQAMNGPYGGEVNDIALSPSGTIYAAANNGLYRSTTAGASWESLPLVPRTITSWAPMVRCDGDSVVYVATMQWIARSTNQGDTWTQCGPAGVRGFTLLPDGVLVAGQSGGIYRSSDRGLTWGLVLNRSDVFYSISRSPNGDLYAGTDMGGVFISRDSGLTWSQVVPQLPSTEIVAFDSSGRIYAGGWGGAFSSTDNGKTWVNVIASSPVLGFAVGPEGTLYAGTFGAGILRSTDHGETWSDRSDGIEGLSVNVVDAGSAGAIWAGTYGGVFRSEDDGNHWIEMNNGILSSVNALVINEHQEVVCGTQSGVQVSPDGGLTWRKSDLTRGMISGLTRAGDNTLYASVGQKQVSGVFRSTDGGDHWTACPGVPCLAPCIGVTRGGDVLVGVNGSGILRSQNKGLTWAESFNGPPRMFPQALALDSAGTLYMGEGGNGIFVSTDDGTTWNKKVNGLGKLWVQCLAVNQMNIIFAGLDAVGLYKSTDKGDNWVPATPPKRDVGAIEFSNNGTIFMGDNNTYGHYTGGVFSSTDMGGSWTNADSGLIDNAVTSLVLDTLGFMYAGTHKGVHRSVRSTSAPPLKPILMSPGPNSVAADEHPLLLWQRAISATRYRLQVSPDTSFSSLLTDTTGVQTDSLRVAGLTRRTKYFWRVKGINGLGEGAWSAVSSFFSQPFSFQSRTGNNAVVAIPASANPKVGSEALYEGDQIGAFTPAGLCVGSIIWTGTDNVLTVWGDNDQTPQVDGITPGEAIQYRIWRKASNIEHWVPTVSYAQGNGIYAPNGIYVIQSLTGDPTGVNVRREIPGSFELLGNYPNPFNPSTTIRYGIPSRTHVSLTLYNALGQIIAVLKDGEEEAGYYSVTFDARDLASGVYLYKLATDRFVGVRKLMVVR